MLADARSEPSPEAKERIAQLEAENAALATRLVAEGHAAARLEVELPALAAAVAYLQQRFDKLIVDARAEIPPGAATQIAQMEKRIAAQEAEIGELRKERDDYARCAGDLEMLRDAALQWRKDAYSPRLQAAIDTFSRRQVAKR